MSHMPANPPPIGGTVNQIAKYATSASLGNSSITDNGTKVHVTATAEHDAVANCHMGTRFDQPIMIYTTLPNGTLDTTYNTQLFLSYDGGSHVGELVNFNIFNTVAKDCSTVAAQCCGQQIAMHPTKTGANALTVIGIQSEVEGGDTNYSWLSTTGFMSQAGGASFGLAVEGVTFGSGTGASANQVLVHATTWTFDSTCTVSLGNTVASFKMPGSAGADPVLNIGFNASPLGQLATKNTNTGGSFGGVEVHLDTTVSASARGGYWIYRGAGAGSELAGMVAPGAANEFATGSAANDLIIYNYDPSSLGQSVCIATGSGPTVRVEVQTGGQTDINAGLKVTGNVGFYGTTPIAQQTGVAVSAAGIHAALVNLGLITA